MIRFLLFVVLVSLASGARAESSAPRANCALRAELEAAAAALSAGDRARALRHLRRAEAVAAACKGRPPPADPAYARVVSSSARREAGSKPPSK